MTREIELALRILGQSSMAIKAPSHNQTAMLHDINRWAVELCKILESKDK
jgi:hypothetical protein